MGFPYPTYIWRYCVNKYTKELMFACLFVSKITHQVMTRFLMTFSIEVNNGPRTRSSNFGDVVQGT